VEGKGNPASATVYLDKLAEELTNRGLEAWLMAPPGRVPSVYITNPGARALEENVYVNQGKDGIWWFWWSWAERISVADDIDAAASAISRVLSLPRSLFLWGDDPPAPPGMGGLRPPISPPRETAQRARRPRAVAGVKALWLL